MSRQVLHGSRTFGIRAWPGKQGLVKFCDDVRAACGLTAADQISLAFSCKAPRSGMLETALCHVCDGHEKGNNCSTTRSLLWTHALHESQPWQHVPVHCTSKTMCLLPLEQRNVLLQA